MPESGLERLADYLWRYAASREDGSASDGDLLARFALSGDREAFAALVGRHGPLVWGICGRMLRRVHDREEAFQATFLVLARRAGAIRQRDSVRSWLYGVAVRVAARARADVLRGQPLTQEEGIDADPALQAQIGEIRSAIDEAVALLPERQRLAVVLAYFEGRTNDEAARQLGCSCGTVATLLARARKRLRRRLVRRGLAPAIGVAALLELENASKAGVPELLSASTVGAASAMRLGLAAGAAMPATASLMEGVMRSMFVSRLKLPALAVAFVLAAGAGVGIWWQPKAEGQSPTAAPELKRPTEVSSTSEVEQLKEQIRQADLLLQGARKRLAQLEKSTPALEDANRISAPTEPQNRNPNGILGSNNVPGGTTGGYSLPTPPAASAGPATGLPAKGPAMGSFGGASEDRLRKIERLAEELRKEVEALRRDSRSGTEHTTPGM